jgi:hypothetical protein
MGAVPATDDSLFFASATAPVAAGLATVRVVAGAPDDVVVDEREVVVGVRVGAVPDVAGGFLAAAVVAAVVLVVLDLLGELGVAPGAVEVRRAVAVVLVAGARFFSSSEAEAEARGR